MPSLDTGDRAGSVAAARNTHYIGMAQMRSQHESPIEKACHGIPIATSMSEDQSGRVDAVVAD